MSNASRLRDNRLPNILFILCDDLGIKDLRCYGRDDHCTQRSAMMRLSRAFSSSNARKRRASLTSIPPYLRFHA